MEHTCAAAAAEWLALTCSANQDALSYYAAKCCSNRQSRCATPAGVPRMES